MTPFFTPVVTMTISFNEKTQPVVKSASHGGGFLRFTPVMEFSITALLLFLLHPAFPKLIVHPEKEAQLSTELLLKEAELVKSYEQPGLCNEVQEEVECPRQAFSF